jgi:uncharacterized Zn-binding protein involved in type VI secretion
MTVSLINGALYIDEKEVHTVIFTNGKYLRFPIENNNTSITTESTSTVVGNENVVISGKNIVSPNSSIKCGGDFILGDR